MKSHFSHLSWSVPLLSSWSIAIGSIAIFLLASCGDDSTENITQINQMGMEIVNKVSELPKCTKDNAGEQAFVKGEASSRVCVDGKWFATASGKDTVIVKDTVVVTKNSTCTTKELKDKSGVKIVCGGESVGVVLNGKNGTNGKDGATGAAGKNGTNGKDGADGKDGDGCSVVTLKDNSGLKVVCGGDSVGVVLNGKDGTNGKDGAAGKNGTNGKDGSDGKDGTGCSMEKVDDFSVRVICGKDSTILYTGEVPDTTGSTKPVVLDSEKIAISLDTVSGVTQKGPFLSGSKVLVREMEDGRTLTQTGNSFNGKILNDKGEFKINARMLVSQYVMLEATGYYRNEVTGENSNSELTLFAITDVNERNTVNVNLLTHLEYERVIYLVTQKKMKVKAAKKQAQKEVFGLLGIDATNFSNSEDLNIAGASDEDAALLAFSIILQGDRSVSQLSELLQKIATDMETDGTWDDAAKRSELADFAAEIDSAGRIAVIRKNVENWGLSSIVPNFEKHVRRFWTTEFGMGECNSKNVGKVVAAKKGLVSRRYICRADSLWHVASDFEKDTYQWKDSTDGALKAGDVTKTLYVFDSTGVHNGGVKGWREPSYLESLYGGCNKKLYGAFRYDNKQGGYYQCQEKSHDWVLFKNDIIIDTQLWSEGEDGYAKWGDSIGVVTPGSKNCYVFDTSAAYKGWRKGSENDCSLGLLGCTAGRAGRMLKSPNTGDYYNCVNNTWTTITDRVLLNTKGWDCLDSNDGEMKMGLVNDAYFVCDYNAWREATGDEETNCRSKGICQGEKKCMEERKGMIYERDGVKFVCDGYYDWVPNVNGGSSYWGFIGTWRKANCAEIATESLCTEALQDSIVWECENLGSFKIDYVCKSNKWRAVHDPRDFTLAQWNVKREKYNAEALRIKANSDSMITDVRDGNSYRTVVINGLRVFAENLRYADILNNVNLKDNISTELNEIYGVRYQWTAAVNLDVKWRNESASVLIAQQHQGVCPEGWHIPDTTEWKTLISGIDGAAIEMKGFEIYPDATDASGFSAIPGIRCFFGGGDCDIHFWSTIEHDFKVTAWILVLMPYGNPGLSYADKFHDGIDRSDFFVRCIQNYPVAP